MLGIQFIRDHADLVREGARRKGEPAPVDEILELDRVHRGALGDEESLRAELNLSSARFGELSRGGGQAIEELRLKLAELKSRIQSKQQERKELEEQLQRLLLVVPNLPHESVPEGQSDDDNQLIRTWGSPPEFAFQPRAHYEVGEALGIFDFERAVKISGSRFAVLRGAGAQLERALSSLMLDMATKEHGYTEVAPPFIVSRDCMVGTANLPKFEEDAFHVVEGDRFLIPTAEVPVTNLYREEILDGDQLPIRHVAWTPCWRSEAGAPGRDTRGYIRLHQFSKVELVKFVHPDHSLEELESLVGDAESVLQALGLHYRVRLMCAGDMGFAQWKKFDIDAWAPGLGRYLEVSSCSVFGDFQARRAGIRFRTGAGRPEFVHTLNGSALALPRTLDCLIETYQTSDGKIRIPERLQPYMGGLAEIS
ncbi:MAG TPA: serine--tRNA ligase [Candidatus Dormibacteraeota bacterium]|nr:serine--tRNA ligase [Candidatus Dormibacteraeota bacterium]